jgi:uncharacterized membrane protein YfcA
MMKCCALVVVAVGFSTGCGGLAATQSFSPLMFFLPGIAESKPVPPQMVQVTNKANSMQIVASKGDLAQVN